MASITPRTDDARQSQRLPWTLLRAGGRYGLADSEVRDPIGLRSEEHTSELQSRPHLVCRLLLEKKNSRTSITGPTHTVRPRGISAISRNCHPGIPRCIPSRTCTRAPTEQWRPSPLAASASQLAG